jgi:uncharacterized protein DUF3467
LKDKQLNSKNAFGISHARNRDVPVPGVLHGGEGEGKLAVEGRSSNHFELAYTEYEFLIDFGQAYGDSGEALVHTRIIMTPRSARTLLQMLQEMVDKYEKTIGPLPERNA